MSSRNFFRQEGHSEELLSLLRIPYNMTRYRQHMQNYLGNLTRENPDINEWTNEVNRESLRYLEQLRQDTSQNTQPPTIPLPQTPSPTSPLSILSQSPSTNVEVTVSPYQNAPPEEPSIQQPRVIRASDWISTIKKEEFEEDNDAFDNITVSDESLSEQFIDDNNADETCKNIEGLDKEKDKWLKKIVMYVLV